MGKKPKPPDRLFWRKPEYLKDARQEAIGGISQEALAQEVREHEVLSDADDPTTRQVIADYETGRTVLRSPGDALTIYKILAVKGSKKAVVAVIELLESEKKAHEHELLDLDPKRIERKRQFIRGWLEDVEADLKRFKAMQ